MFGSGWMWAGAHELNHPRGNTLVMSSHRSTPESSAGPGLNTARAVDGVVVSEWRDAVTLAEADLSGEIAGQKVVPLVDGSEQCAVFEPVVKELLRSYRGTPGFLLNGDDGDSLWFWPEGEPVAFRFEQESSNRLRRMLAESVSRLVSQGALVFCYQERESKSGDPIFHFPELGLRAA